MLSASIWIICDRLVCNCLISVAPQKGQQIIFSSLRFVGTPVERPRSFVSQFFKMGTRVVVFENIDINYSWIAIVHGLGPECKTLRAALWVEGMWWGMGWEEGVGEGSFGKRVRGREKRRFLPSHTLVKTIPFDRSPNWDQTIWWNFKEPLIQIRKWGWGGQEVIWGDGLVKKEWGQGRLGRGCREEKTWILLRSETKPFHSIPPMWDQTNWCAPHTPIQKPLETCTWMFSNKSGWSRCTQSTE